MNKLNPKSENFDLECSWKMLGGDSDGYFNGCIVVKAAENWRHLVDG